MPQYVVLLGETGTGKTTSIKYQGGDVVVERGTASSTKVVSQHKIANGDIAIDTPGLDDTRHITGSTDIFSNAAHKTALLRFMSANRISAFHGVQWHVHGHTRLNQRLLEEAKFIHELVGNDGWTNVVVLILGVALPQAQAVIVEAVQRFAGAAFTPVIRGVEKDQRLANTSICLVANQTAAVAKALKNLRVSSKPIQFCYFNRTCTICKQTGDPRTYAACHRGISNRHGNVTETFIHTHVVEEKPHVRQRKFGRAAAEATEGVVAALPATAAFIPVDGGLSLIAGGLVAGATGVATGVSMLLPGSCAGCDKITYESGVCYYSWACCTKRVPGGNRKPSSQDYGCTSKKTCVLCKGSAASQGCVAYCSGCGRTQSDKAFPLHGCSTKAEHNVIAI